MRALYSRESRERHRRGIEHGDRAPPLRRAPDRRAQEALRARLVAAFGAQRGFENERRKPGLPPLRKHALCESRVVMAHERLIQGMLGIARLDQDLAREIRASGSSRDLLQLRKGPLARTIIARE